MLFMGKAEEVGVEGRDMEGEGLDAVEIDEEAGAELAAQDGNASDVEDIAVGHGTRNAERGVCGRRKREGRRKKED